MSDDPLFDDDDEANTSLAPEDRDGLIPSYITSRRELNEAEQVNIDKGDRWAINPRARHDVLTEDFIRAAQAHVWHVWRWAGEFRPTARNIGVDAWKIGTPPICSSKSSDSLASPGAAPTSLPSRLRRYASGGRPRRHWATQCTQSAHVRALIYDS